MALMLDVREGFVIATLSWDGPDCLLDPGAANTLAGAIAAAEDAGHRALVLTAAGAAFCLGDTGEAADVSERTPTAVAAAALAAAVIPTIGVIEGHAGEGGLELALACDLRIASHTASFSAAHLQHGDFPAAGGAQRLARAAGRALALQMLLLGDTVDAAAALSGGLVQRVTRPGEALAAAVAWAERLASGAPIATQYLKEAIVRGMEQPLFEGLQREADLYFLLQTTADHDEGLRAFREKRTPRFEGR